jgi:soluble lytic murein transglycosylase
MALTCIKTIRRVACVALLATSLQGAFAQAPATASDADVLALRDAAQRGQWRVFNDLRPRLAGHPLEAYAAYWKLAGSVDRSDPNEVRAFLDRYPRGPLADAIRKEWLRALGAAGSWDTFRAEWPRMAGDDAEITCYAMQERIARGDTEALSEARALFIEGRETPAACDVVYAAAAAANRIAEPEAWERIRKLLSAGAVRDAKRAQLFLPAAQRIADKTLDKALANPAHALTQEKSARLTRAQQEVAIFAVSRLARAKPEDAAERLAAVAARLTPEMAAFAWAQVAWQAALVHHPRALEWYERAGNAPLTEAQATWKARAALRTGDWALVLRTIQELPPEEARDPAWRYWRSRCLRAAGEKDAADALLRPLARETSFYGLLAADELGTLPSPDWAAWQPLPGELDRIRAMEGVQRALLLYRMGLDNEAFREWIWAMRGLDDRSLNAAAEVARQAGVFDRAINTADRTVQLHDFNQRYPVPHREALSASAKQWGLDEAIVYSLIRQESRFVAVARSRVGATGLMQLMPATARWVAKQIPVEHFKPEMLEQPEMNILMGSYYFRRVLADLGHPVLATAAYNAGPGRARRWRDERPLEAAIYAETIPFNETRDYVKKVFANAWFYRHRLSGHADGFRAMLGSVPGRQGEPADGRVAAVLP